MLEAGPQGLVDWSKVRTRLLGVLSSACLTATVLWLVFLILGLATAGPLATFDQVLAHVGKLDALFYLTYANAALVTVTAVMLFAALYVFCRSRSETWAAIALTFVPIYGAMNLLVYLSQITIVPRLLTLMATPESASLAGFMLRQTIQQWPDSAVFVANNLAYAVLGVPSIVFGVLLPRTASRLRPAGVLLALSGIASIAGFAGIAAGSRIVGNGSLVGGVLFLFALVAMSWAFLGGATVATETA